MLRIRGCSWYLSFILCLGPYCSPKNVHAFLSTRKVAVFQFDGVPSPGNSLLETAKDGGAESNVIDDLASSLDASEYGAQFIDRVRELESYKRENGDCLVPKRYEANPSLGNWVNKQRQQYRKYKAGENSSLFAPRIEILDKVGFVWEVDPTIARKARSDRLWMDRFDELRQYQAEHGTCRVSADAAAASSKLRSWVSRQRREYRRYARGDESALTPERIEMLDGISFEGTSAFDDQWAARVKELIEYKAKFGDCLVPRTYSENQSLGQWVHTQRKRWKQMEEGRRPYGLTAERIQELDGIGFVWDYREHEVEQFMDEFERRKAT